MKNQSTSWNRLAAGARLAPADLRDTSAPAGFSTRIAALAFGSVEPTFGALFARFSLRSLGVCGLLMVVGVSLNFSSALNAFEADNSVITDPVAEWLNAAS